MASDHVADRWYFAEADEYARQAQALYDAVRSHDNKALWRFKWQHPRFRGKTVSAVDPAALDLADAQLVVASQHHFATWPDLLNFSVAVRTVPEVTRFEEAADAVVFGNLPVLHSMLQAHPELVHTRSARRHHATLLHYVGANGVEDVRQRTPANAIDVTKTLLDAGAEVDALADMYENKCTTMSMLVSSCHPAKAGLQAALAETLLDYGAALDEGPGTKWQSPLLTALAFGYLDTAKTLANRGALVDNVAAAAGLGRVEEVARLLSHADSDRQSKHIALALAAQHGHVKVVEMLLDAGEDPNRFNPEGFHAHSTPLHQAVGAGHEDVVRLLVERGARLDIKDTIFSGNPLGWAVYCEKPAIAEYLRARGAPE
jgi:ankyrin repeat protein